MAALLDGHAETDERRRPLLLHEHRAFDPLARRDVAAVHDSGARPAVTAEEDVACVARARLSEHRVGELYLGPSTDRGHLEADQLDRLAVDRVAVAGAVDLVEALERIGQSLLADDAVGQFDLVLVVLTEVAHVDGLLDLGLPGEPLLTELLERALGDVLELP